MNTWDAFQVGELTEDLFIEACVDSEFFGLVDIQEAVICTLISLMVWDD